MTDPGPAALLAFMAQATGYGMTVAEFAECVSARAKIREQCEAAARRHLSGQRAGLLARLDQRAAAVIGATAAMGPSQTSLDTLTARLDQCRELLAEARHLAGDDDGDLTELATASGRAEVLARQERKIADRIAVAQQDLHPHAVALATARTELADAERELASLDAAIADPLADPMGLGTLPGAYYVIASGAWFEHLDPAEARTPLGQMAHQALRQALVMSGEGERIERRILDGMKAEQDRLRGVTGSPTMQVASAPGLDPAKIPPPQSFQLSPASASAEQAAMRDAAGGWQPQPGLPVHGIGEQP